MVKPPALSLQHAGKTAQNCTVKNEAVCFLSQAESASNHQINTCNITKGDSKSQEREYCRFLVSTTSCLTLEVSFKPRAFKKCWQCLLIKSKSTNISAHYQEL